MRLIRLTGGNHQRIAHSRVMLKRILTGTGVRDERNYQIPEDHALRENEVPANVHDNGAAKWA